MFRLIAIPLGLLMELCYKLIRDYGIALLAFTVLIKIILLPLQIKQQKSTAKMQRYQPEIEKIKKKYGKNNEQLQQKLAEFYAKEGVSPAGSCLPMIISMLVLFSLINVVYQPIYYVLNDIDNGKIDRASSVVSSLYTVCYDIKDNEIDFEKLVAMYDADQNGELSDEEKGTMITALNENKVTDKDGKEYNFKETSSIKEAEIDDKKYSSKEQITSAVEALMMYRGETEEDNLYLFMIDDSKVSKQLRARPELVVINIIKDGFTLPFEKIDSKLVSEIQDFNYTLLGFGLGVYPSTKNLTVLIPIISFVTQLVCTFVSNYFTKKNNPSVQMGGGMKMMMYVMPLFSLFIAFGFPAGLGIYWIYSGILSLVQIIVLNLVYTPDRIGRMVDKDMAKNKKRRKTMMQKMLEMQNADGTSAEVAKRLSFYNEDDDDDDDDDEHKEKKELSKAELKELQRKKLNEARKRMAEKYGDEYYED